MLQSSICDHIHRPEHTADHFDVHVRRVGLDGQSDPLAGAGHDPQLNNSNGRTLPAAPGDPEIASLHSGASLLLDLSADCVALPANSDGPAGHHPVLNRTTLTNNPQFGDLSRYYLLVHLQLVLQKTGDPGILNQLAVCV